MAIAELQQWLFDRPWLQADYEKVVASSIISQFPSIQNLGAGEVVWERLLSASSVLAQSEKGSHQEVALRIAQECVQNPQREQHLRDAASIVLDMLANRRAISLVGGESQAAGVESRLGFNGRLNWTLRTFEHSVQFQNGEVVEVNRFQSRFWEATSQRGWISASAPTSAGKSFILLRRVVESVTERPWCTVIYVAPTRALVHEVELELRRQCYGRQVRANISTIPLNRSVRDGMANVLVFTQERLHLLLSRLERKLKIDVLIVDEAQKISDGQRGVLLQHAIERVVEGSPAVDVTFVTPQAANPEVLIADAPSGVPAIVVPSEDVTVNQNLIWVSQVPGDTTSWFVQSCIADRFRDLGILQLRDRPTTVPKRMSLIAFEMGGSSVGNLIYANRPSDAENIALQLVELVKADGERQPAVTLIDAELIDLAELAKKTVHSRFNLAQYVPYGVAYHYGNMPFLLRSEIERLFKSGKIKFLVCTSTLIEGVNLACRSVFLRGPTRGREPMSDADFWNLAGRAGRWGRDRAGNIICIDPRNIQVWHGKTAPQVKVKQEISKATEKVLAEPNEIITFIETGTPRDVAGAKPSLEHTTAYLMSLHLTGRGGAAATRWARRFDPDTIARIDSATAAALDAFPVRADVVARNPGISPLAMAKLLQLFRERSGDLRDLIPTTPEDETALDNYIGVFTRIGQTLTSLFSNRGRTFALTLLILHWMRGWPLPRLIDGQLKYQETHNISRNVPATIRKVMEEVETVARFAAPKYLGCYVDVLRQHLEEKQQAELIGKMEDFQILLEYGVSSITEMSLLALGLSRTSAVLVFELMIKSDLDEGGCLAWFAENDPEDLDLPAAVRREIATARQFAVLP